MNSKNVNLNVLLAIIGIALFLVGAVGMKMDWFSDWEAIPAILIGAGSGLFAYNIGLIIDTKIRQKAPAAARKMAIEQKDERNMLISNTAKGKAFDAMIPIFVAVMTIIALMGVDIQVLLILVGAFLLVNGIWFYQFMRLSKEM
jgi:hypothetical protein